MSENEQEWRKTLADIVAEMRTRSREIKEAFGGRPDGVENMLDIWADRIEAIDSADAWRSLYTPGNAAAMREALSDACYAMFNFLKTQNGGYEEMANALDKAKAALAAPARNCDLSGGDYKMLHTAWFDWTGSPSGHLPADGTAKMTFAAWLLAPAAERKGDGDGE